MSASARADARALRPGCAETHEPLNAGRGVTGIVEDERRRLVESRLRERALHKAPGLREAPCFMSRSAASSESRWSPARRAALLNAAGFCRALKCKEVTGQARPPPPTRRPDAALPHRAGISPTSGRQCAAGEDLVRRRQRALPAGPRIRRWRGSARSSLAGRAPCAPRSASSV